MSKYSAEQIAWLAANRSQFSAQQLTDEFNLLFGTSLSAPLIKSICHNHGIPGQSGGGQFRKGNVPANKGKRCPATHPNQIKNLFSCNHRPHNWQPVGSEREDIDGYFWVKIAEPNIWKEKAHLVWTEHNPPKPPKHHIIYLDNNRSNVVIENLYMISFGEMAVLNRHENWRSLTPELKKSLITIIRLEQARKKSQEKVTCG